MSYTVSMVLSYFFGQKYYPIKYPLKDIAFYVALALVVFFVLDFSNTHLSMWLALGVNTLLIIAFAAVIVKRDFWSLVKARLRK